MKIVSWNVNGIRAVEKKESILQNKQENFTSWLLNSNIDVLCIQETKACSNQLSPNLLNPVDITKNISYKSYFYSAKKPGYSGTAIYCKNEPDSVENLGNPKFDDEGRVTIVKFGKLAIISAYFPNSQDDEEGNHPRLQYKLEFNIAIKQKCDDLVSKGFDVVLCGDYNVAHKEIDLANPKTNTNHCGFLKEERDWFESFVNSGYVDTFRYFNKEEKQYSWWSYRFHAREKNIGWRIDYQCINKELLPKLKSSTIMNQVFGSDHCPIQIELSE